MLNKYHLLTPPAAAYTIRLAMLTERSFVLIQPTIMLTLQVLSTNFKVS